MKYSFLQLQKKYSSISLNLKFIPRFRKEIHFNLFFLGLFFLLSAPSFSALFLFISLIIAKFKKEDRKFPKKFSNIFCLSGVIFILSALISSLNFDISYSEMLIRTNLEYWDPINNWIGLFNWLPFLFFFSEFQYYLQTKTLRRKASFFLISGTVPLIITVLGQVYFNWYGPFSFAGGLIKWFQRPIMSTGATGLFNNANYAGSWLLAIWPLSIGFLIYGNKKLKSKKFVLIIITFLIFFTTLLTKSRNALMGIIISLPLLLNKLILFWYLPLLIIILIIISLIVLPIFPAKLATIVRTFIPEIFISKFNFIDILNLYEIPRISLWVNSVRYIMERPFWGWGAASFPIIYGSRTNLEVWYGHTHNIFLEVSYNYGVLSALSLAIPIIIILKKSFENIYLNRSSYLNKNHNYLKVFEKAWWTSSFCLLINQQFDMQYYDLRVSILMWVLLAGLASSDIKKEIS